MLSKIINAIREYFYTPKIGDKYIWDIKPSFLFSPWECDTLRAIIYEVLDIREGYIKYRAKDRKIETESISKFKKRYNRVV